MTKLIVALCGLIAVAAANGKRGRGRTGNSNIVQGKWNRARGNQNEINGDENSVIGNRNHLNGDFNGVQGSRNSIWGSAN